MGHTMQVKMHSNSYSRRWRFFLCYSNCTRERMWSHSSVRNTPITIQSIFKMYQSTFVYRETYVKLLFMVGPFTFGTEPSRFSVLELHFTVCFGLSPSRRNRPCFYFAPTSAVFLEELVFWIIDTLSESASRGFFLFLFFWESDTVPSTYYKVKLAFTPVFNALSLLGSFWG